MRPISLSDNSKAVEFLIKSGADVHLANNNGETALLHAAHDGNLKKLKISSN